MKITRQQFLTLRLLRGQIYNALGTKVNLVNPVLVDPTLLSCPGEYFSAFNHFQIYDNGGRGGFEIRSQYHQRLGLEEGVALRLCQGFIEDVRNAISSGKITLPAIYSFGADDECLVKKMEGGGYMLHDRGVATWRCGPDALREDYGDIFK